MLYLDKISVHKNQLSMIEKTELLLSTSIFKHSPSAEIAELALSVDTHYIKEGNRLIEEGSNGTSLYVLAKGRVSVHNGNTIVASLQRGAIIGELAALDPEPRSASVTANENCVVIKLEGYRLREFMRFHPQVSRGIFHILCSRIRNSSSKKNLHPHLSKDSFEMRPSSKTFDIPLFDINRALVKCPLFQNLPYPLLEDISSNVMVKFAKTGEDIIREGEIGESIFILIDGQVCVHDETGTLAELGEGTIFGELSVLDPEPRSATVTALSDSMIFQISGKLIYELLSVSQDLMNSLIHELCKRLRNK